MRTVVAFSLLVALLGGCESKPEAETSAAPADPAAQPALEAPPPAQAPPAMASAPAPRLGGAIVASGEFGVEVVTHTNGGIDATVTTAAGEPVANADVAALQVTAQGEGDARHEVALRWDAARAVFHGAAKADARLASGPLQVSCSIRGKEHKGHLDLLVALPSARFGGRMLALGRYSAEVVPKVDGAVDVHLQDAAGAALRADAGFALRVRARGKANAMQDIALRWDAARACFTGKLEASAELAGGPLELTARADVGAELKGGVEAIALLAPPSIGGSVIATGDYTVEIAPQVDGQIDAIVRNSAGATVEGGVELEAHVQAGGQLRPVKLVWNPALLRFRGKLEGDFKLEPGPIELALVADGRLRVGSIVAAAVMPKIDVDAKAGADLVAEADAKLDAKAKGKAKLPALAGKASGDAKLSVNVPKPTVNVKAGAAADAKASGSAKAGATGAAAAKGEAKQQGGVKIGGSLSSGLSIGTK
jgi:hypothetical protein